MDPKYFSHHRQSLRPGGTTTSSMLANRYGLQLGGSGGSKSTSATGGGLGIPTRSRSNSTSRFKAAAAVAVAAATGSKTTKHHHRPSTAFLSSSTSTSISGSSISSNTTTTSGLSSSIPSGTGLTAAGSTVGANISSSVVSFMKKFVNKATPSSAISDSIDSSIEQYQKQQQQRQQSLKRPAATGTGCHGTAAVPPTTSPGGPGQSPTKYLFSAISGAVAAAGGQTTTTSDTGYSSNANSPVTTPTVYSSTTPPVVPSSTTDVLNSNTIISGQLNNNGRGPLFSKIRAKVASTFQQQQQQQPASSSVVSTPGADGPNNITEQQRQQRSSSITSSNGTVPSTTTTGQRAPMLALIPNQSSSLTNEQLTAHLTDEERQILQKVWQKEEEFREIALKNFNKNFTADPGVAGAAAAVAIPAVETPTAERPTAAAASGTSTVSPIVTGDVSHLSTNLLDPVAAAVHRRRSSAIMSADATGFCRICRKVIMKNESAHRCSNCHELVCDDCSSYSSREESKYWMCSFCRRRGSHLVLVTTSTGTAGINSVSESNTSGATTTTTTTGSPILRPPILNVTSNTESSAGGNVRMFRKMSATQLQTDTNTPTDTPTNQQQQQQSFLNPDGSTRQRKLSYQELKRPKSAMENGQTSARQSSLDSNNRLFAADGGEQPKFNKLLPSPMTQQRTPTPTIDSRARIYSLSDDEELWQDEEDDDDDDGDERLGQDDDENDDDDDDDVLTVDQPIRQRQRSKSEQPSPHYGTLEAAPPEALKRQRSAQCNKKKKKKLNLHQGVCNSDDELVNYYANKTTTTLDGAGNTPPIMIMAAGGDSVVKKETEQPASSSSSLISAAPETNNGISYQQCQNKQPLVMPKIISKSGIPGVKPPPGAITATHWWRLSTKARGLSRGSIDSGGGGGFYFRKQLSSESSDLSDGCNTNKYSPPQESLTPSSDFSRSPRESADSDMLGLNGYGGHHHHRQIPSVMVADAGSGADSIYLSTKDCYLRRGSTGRCLPAIPTGGAEPSRSMLDLPHSRKSSAHSLDIPNEQPRRASAPESGDNIRIVIDECGDLSTSHLDLVAANGSQIINSGTGNGGPGPGSGSPVVQPHQTTFQQRMRYQMSRAASITTHYERTVLQRDRTDPSTRTRGFGLAITGGKLCEIDGMLYAYISWIKPNGQADRQGLKVGDKILEWSGRSLVNCSHEQVCHIMDVGGDQPEVIAESMVRSDMTTGKYRRHSLTPSPKSNATAVAAANKTAATSSESVTTKERSNSGATPRPSSAAAMVTTTSVPFPSASSSSISPLNASTGNLTGTGSSRRRLPQIPPTAYHLSSSTSSIANLLSDAQILIQVTVDANIRQLSVMIIRAKSLDRHPIYVQNPVLEAYAQLRLLPEMGFKICQTELSRAFDWNETLIYHQFPLERIEKITLDLSIWCSTPATYIPGLDMPTTTTTAPRITVGSASTSPIILSGNSPAAINQPVQLASTRIPLRSALMMHNSEWWPLIPCNADVPANYLLPSSQFLDPTPPAAATGGHFQKAPSMDHLDSGGGLNGMLSDQMLMMMSRSTPGSRRNSNRSQEEMIAAGGGGGGGVASSTGGHLMIGHHPSSTSNSTQNLPIGGHHSHHLSSYTGSLSARGSLNRLKNTPTPPSLSNSNLFLTRYRGSPSSRASFASTQSSSTGRHSLDESISGGGGNGRSRSSSSNIRFTSLRLAQNRHSVGNLFQTTPAAGSKLMPTATTAVPGNSFLTSSTTPSPPIDHLALRRKSSSALLRNRIDLGGRAPENNNLLPASIGYTPISNTDSYQYLLEQTNDDQNNNNNNREPDANTEMGYQSDQESDLDTSDEDDEDFDNLLKDSNYTLDSLENRTAAPTVTTLTPAPPPVVVRDSPSAKEVPSTLALAPATNLLGVDDNRSRLTTPGSITPRTPSQDEYDDDNDVTGASLTIPSACQERRPSLLRRLMPQAAETVMNIVMGGAGGSNAQPSDEILHNFPANTTNNTTTNNNNNNNGNVVDHYHNGNGPMVPAAAKKTIVIVGEIKLGFIMTKGFLEIEVIAARNLPDSSLGPHPPDTYVKTYLVDRGRQLYKRKTGVVPGNKNPHYRQTLKYDASIIYGRSLLVSVWEKQRRRHTFDANSPIGSVEINVNQLQLHKLTIRWFKLRSLITTDSGTTTSVSTSSSHLKRDSCDSENTTTDASTVIEIPDPMP